MLDEKHRRYIGLPSREDIKGSHPDWLRENVSYALGTGNFEEHTRRMVLLSNLCHKCHNEMGEHILKLHPGKGSCPPWSGRSTQSTEEVTITDPSGRELSKKEAEGFLEGLQRGTFYVGQ